MTKWNPYQTGFYFFKVIGAWVTPGGRETQYEYYIQEINRHLGSRFTSDLTKCTKWKQIPRRKPIIQLRSIVGGYNVDETLQLYYYQPAKEIKTHRII